MARDAPGSETGTLPIDPDRELPIAEGRRDPQARRRAERTVLGVVATAGAVGALARYGLSRVVHSAPGHFPWSTFSINVSGSLAIGLVLVLLTERFPRARVARLLVATGFLGAYTTFSTYMVDADLLFRGHDLLTGAVYALASLVAGVAAALAGILLGRFLASLDRRLSEHLG